MSFYTGLSPFVYRTHTRSRTKKSPPTKQSCCARCFPVVAEDTLATEHERVSLSSLLRQLGLPVQPLEAASATEILELTCQRTKWVYVIISFTVALRLVCDTHDTSLAQVCIMLNCQGQRLTLVATL